MKVKSSPPGAPERISDAAAMRDLVEQADTMPQHDPRRVAASLAMFDRLTEHWSLRNAEREALLGGIVKSTWSEWRQRPALARIKPDTRERIANLFTIDLNAHSLFAPEFADRWIRERNAAFQGASPLSSMLRGRVEDVKCRKSTIPGRIIDGRGVSLPDDMGTRTGLAAAVKAAALACGARRGAHREPPSRRRHARAHARGDRARRLATWSYDDAYAAAASDPTTLLPGARSVVCVAVAVRDAGARASGAGAGASRPTRGRATTTAACRRCCARSPRASTSSPRGRRARRRARRASSATPRRWPSARSPSAPDWAGSASTRA